MEEKKEAAPRKRGQVIPLGNRTFGIRVPLKEKGKGGRQKTHYETVRGMTPIQAEKYKEKLLAKIDAGLWFTVADMTFETLKKEWLEQKRRKKLSPKTIYSYESLCNAYLSPLYTLRLSAINPSVLKDLLNNLQDRGFANSTMREAANTLNLILRYAIGMNYIEKNPLKGVEMPVGAEGREKRSLTIEHARTLIDAALLNPPDLKFIFALFTGLRPEELTGLTSDRIELISEREAVVRVCEVAFKERWGGWHLIKPKTPKSIRDVPFPAWLYHKLREMEGGHLVYSPMKLLFPNARGLPYYGSLLMQEFNRLLKRAGLPLYYTPYSLRYAYNTFLYMTDVSGRARCDLMGHVEERFNEKTYVKSQPEMFEGVTGRLENLIFGETRAAFAQSAGERPM
jgi:integrase